MIDKQVWVLGIPDSISAHYINKLQGVHHFSSSTSQLMLSKNCDFDESGTFAMVLMLRESVRSFFSHLMGKNHVPYFKFTKDVDDTMS